MTRVLVVVLAMAAVLWGGAGAVWAQWNDDAAMCYSGTKPKTDIPPDVAIYHCTRAINSGELSQKNLAKTFTNRGITYYNKGRYDRAIADFTTAIELEPDDAIAYYARGRAYANKDQYDRAIQDYDQAIRLRPDYASAFLNRGNAYFNNKRLYDRAIADYTKAIELKPDDAKAYEKRSAAYEKYYRWDPQWDINRDGEFSAADLVGWAIWLFFVPGDAIIGLLLDTAGLGKVIGAAAITMYGSWISFPL